jgi:hypothetical protein
MFAFYASIFTVALSMYPSVSAQNAAGFDALSVPERREAIQQVANGIRAGESVDSKAMAMVGMALGDSDPFVRLYAAVSISTILHGNGPGIRKRTQPLRFGACHFSRLTACTTSPIQMYPSAESALMHY